MSRLQDPDADRDPEYDGPLDELRFLVGSALDEAHSLPEQPGLGDERADQALRPVLLDQGGRRVLLRAEVLSMKWKSYMC